MEEELRLVEGWLVSSKGDVYRPAYDTVIRNQMGETPIRRPQRKMTKSLDSKGYYFVCGGKRTKRMWVARLVALGFVPNPENKPIVNHINGVKTDNRAENLEWCTHSENLFHAHRTGLKVSTHGQHHHNNVHPEDNIRAVYRELLSGELSQTKIAEKYGIPQITVSNIWTKTTWSTITDPLDKEYEEREGKPRKPPAHRSSRGKRGSYNKTSDFWKKG